jgi:hypothetical protein
MIKWCSVVEKNVIFMMISPKKGINSKKGNTNIKKGINNS